MTVSLSREAPGLDGVSSLKLCSASSGGKNQEFVDWMTEQDNTKDCVKTRTLRNRYNANNPPTVGLLSVNTLSFALFPPFRYKAGVKKMSA